MHGRIGLPAMNNVLITSGSIEAFFDNLVQSDVNCGFYKMSIAYLNARHYMFDQTDSELQPDVKNFLLYLIDEYMPLGILDMKEIANAEQLLTEIYEMIKMMEFHELQSEFHKPHLLNDVCSYRSLSDQFYRMIPHAGGDQRRPLINNYKIWNAKYELLIQMKSALNVLHEAHGNTFNPLDYFCERWLKSTFKVCKRNSKNFQTIANCIKRTQHLRDAVLFNIENIFVVNSRAHANFNDEIPNHRYLFHSTYANNILGILRKGLLVAPNYVHSVNRFFGNGIYFWDSAAAALNIFRSNSFSEGIILVCRVALGKIQRVSDMPYLKHGQKYPWEDGYDSLFFRSKIYPESRNAKQYINGVPIYCGQMPTYSIEDYDFHRYERYNEYIVKNANQIKIDYIIQLRKK